MAGPGNTIPKPEGQRRRRNATVPMTQLPAGGRHGDPPAWPLRGRQTAAVKELWAELWATPQAVAWERLRWTRTVARYVRVVLDAEGGDSQSRVEARQLEDRLGLNPLAMLRLRWEVAGDEVAERRAEPPVKPAGRRLRAVDPDAVAGR